MSAKKPRYVISALWKGDTEVWWTVLGFRDDEKHARSWASKFDAKREMEKQRPYFDGRISDVQVGEQSAYGKNTSMQVIRGKKNPAKKKPFVSASTHAAYMKEKRFAKKHPAKKTRVLTVTGRKNPSLGEQPKQFVLRFRRDAFGKKFSGYFTGAMKLDTDKKKAAIYSDHRAAENLLDHLEKTYPKVMAEFVVDIIQA